MKIATEIGVEMRIGVKVQSVDVEHTKIKLEDGSEVSVDLIIAADGVHSVVRPHIIDTRKHYPTATTGHNAFRFMVSRSDAESDPTLSAAIRQYRMLSWFGNNRRILVYPVDYGKQFNITCTHPQELSDQEATGNDAEAVGESHSALQTEKKKQFHVKY